MTTQTETFEEMRARADTSIHCETCASVVIVLAGLRFDVVHAMPLHERSAFIMRGLTGDARVRTDERTAAHDGHRLAFYPAVMADEPTAEAMAAAGKMHVTIGDADGGAR